MERRSAKILDPVFSLVISMAASSPRFSIEKGTESEDFRRFAMFVVDTEG